ncbi:MAG: hypothetical protein KAI67_03990 [Candidatus Pacebacteria bacterium]|nr:hypothetical protein [Candidatus Paceibacterota bacterium]
MKKIILIESIFIFFLGIIILAQLTGISWNRKEFITSCQPESIKYNSYDSYCVSITKEYQALNSELYIWVAKEVDPSYGHVISYPNPSVIDEQELQDTKINWTNEGIEIETYLNTKIFIPKKNFIEGR